MARRRYRGQSGVVCEDEALPLDIKKDPKENMQFVLKEITTRSKMSADKKMGYVNNFTKLIQSSAVGTDFGFSQEEIIICLRVAVFNNSKEVRAAAVRALRYIFTDENSFSLMMKLKIDILIVRCLDKKQDSEVERVQALRFVRKVVAVCSHLFPMSFAQCLVAIAGDKSKPQDRLSRACLATLCELAVSNVKVASYCGGINTIITSILDSQVHRMNECLVLTLLFLMNSPLTRCYVRPDVGLEGILAPFTDLHYNHGTEIPESQIREDRESRLQASKMAMSTVFKTWPGIIYLCKPDGNGLQSILQIFCIPDELIKRHIMDVLMDVFRLPIPEWTDDFAVALKSIDPRRMKNSWKLSEGFVAEEARSLLPFRANSRVDLLRNYTAIVLSAFVTAGLFESLVQVITTSGNLVSVRATIVLGQLLHMANTLLPPECSSHTHCLPTLMNIATSFQVTRQERGRASSAVNCLDRLHQLKKRRLIPQSLFLEFLTMQSKSSDSKNKKKRERDRENIFKYSRSENDNEEDMIRELSMGSANECDILSWDIIAAVLQSPTLNLRKLEEIGCISFISNLLYFYQPSSQQFCTVEFENIKAKKLSEIGLLLIDFLLANIYESQRMIEDFAREFSECLAKTTKDANNGILGEESLMKTASRYYFVFFGRLSCSSEGHKILSSTRVYEHYLDLASMKSRDCLLKLILASLDYRRNEISRIILSKILTVSTKNVRLYATKFLRALLRAKVAFFNNWGIELLVTQLYDHDYDIAMESADVLEEASEDEANLQYLVQLRPALLHLGEKGWRLLTRFLSVDKGFTYLTGLGYVHSLMEQWREKYCCEYVKWVEEALAEALTTYQKPTDEDGGYVRQSCRKNIKHHVYVPTHFFGEIVKLKSGYEYLCQTGYVGQFVNTVQMFDFEKTGDILNVKTALWTLGHIGTSSWGLSILLEENIIPLIVEMANCCGVLTVRGTCFYVLGLIATTHQGVDILKTLNWESVRHKVLDLWPVVEVKEEALPYSKWFVSSLSTVTDYYLQSVDESVKQRKSESETEDGHKSLYDEASGVYLGLERRLSNVYDKSSGVYLGEEAPKVPKHDEGTGSGILMSMLEEKQQQAYYEEEHDSFLFQDERSSGSPEDVETKSETPSLLERIKNVSIPAHLMPPPAKPFSSRKSRSENDSPRGMKRRTTPARQDNSPKLLARSESHPINPTNFAKHSPESDSSGHHNNQLKTINLAPYEGSFGENSLISRILKSQSTVPVKDGKTEADQSSASPLSSTPGSRVVGESDEVRHVRSSSGVSESSCRSISSMETSQSFGSYRSHSSLEENIPVHLELDKTFEKTLKKQQLELSRARSSSLNEKGSSVDPRLSIKTEARSASFSGMSEDMKSYPVRANRQFCLSNYSMSSPVQEQGSLMVGSNTEVMLLDNKTLVLKNLSRNDEIDEFGGSYFDEMSVCEGGLGEIASMRNDLSRDVEMPVDEIMRKFPRNFYSRSASSSSLAPRARRLKKSSTSMSIWSLQSVPISPTSPGDADNPDVFPTYTSFRDAYGYSALSNLRKKRSINRDIESRIGGMNQSFAIVGPPIPVSRPVSLDIVSESQGSVSSSLPTPSPMDHQYGRKLTVSSSRGNELMGLTLPIDLNHFFLVPESPFKGSWATNFNAALSNMSGNHLSSKIKSSGVSGSKSSKQLSFDECEEDGSLQTENIETKSNPSKSKSQTTSFSGSILEKFLKGKQLDAVTGKDQALIKREILRLVMNLSSAVTSRSHQESLRSWKECVPQFFEDLFLYHQVMEQMALYNYKLHMRRFIQEFFENIKFTQLNDEADVIMKKIHN